MIVLCCSRAVRDLLASKACDMGRSIGVVQQRRECHKPSPLAPYHLHNSAGRSQAALNHPPGARCVKVSSSELDVECWLVPYLRLAIRARAIAPVAED